MRVNTAVALLCAAFAFALPDTAVAASADCEGCSCFMNFYCDTGQVTMPQKCITHEGVQRCWHIHKPNGIGNKKVPLVVDIHGYSVPVYTNLVSGLVHGGGHYDISRWKQKANQNEFIVVYPVGTGFIPAWNAGNGCCGDGAKDDSGFIKKLIDWMKGGYSIDGDRVYLAGHSNGCSLAQRVAIEYSGVIAGVACHAMYRLGGYATPPSYSPRSVMEIHGTGDAIISYSNYANWPHGASANIDAWAALNECPSKTSNPNLGNGMSDVTWNNCKDPAVSHRLLTLEGVDHYPYLGKGTMLDTTQEAWNFLKDLRMSKYGSAQSADATPGKAPPTPPTPPAPTKSDCTDLERPLDNLGLPDDGEYIQWSCIEYKAYYGLGLTDACDPDVIAAHPNCIAEEDCKANPGFINTRCPASCRIRSDPGTCSCDCYTREYPNVNLFEGVHDGKQDNSCQEDFQNSGFEKYDSCCMYGPSDGLCCTDLERPLDNLDLPDGDSESEQATEESAMAVYSNAGCTQELGTDGFEQTRQEFADMAYMPSDCVPDPGKCFVLTEACRTAYERRFSHFGTEYDGKAAAIRIITWIGDGGEGDGKGEHIEWSCAEYKAYYGLGLTDACDPDVIAAHPNCYGEEGCKANPGFINTRCPISCQPMQPDTCTPSYECSAAEYDELITAYINRLSVECPKACSQAPLDYPDTLLPEKLAKCSNEDIPEWTTDSCGTAKCATFRASIEFENTMELLDKCHGVDAVDDLKASLTLECAVSKDGTSSVSTTAAKAVLTGDAIRNLISSVVKLAGINEADSKALTDAVAGLTGDTLNAFISGGAPDMSALLEDSTVKSALETAGVNVGLLASSLEVTSEIHDGSGAACTVLSATAMTFAAVNAAMLF